MSGVRACIAIASLTLLTACSGWQSAMDAHGQSAEMLRQLILVIMAVCALVWLVVIAILLHALWRRRDRSRDHPLALEARRERKMMVAVVVGIAATVIVITGFTVISFFATRSLATAGPSDLLIDVRGRQWWWDITYHHDDPTLAFRTANEIHIPVGRNVLIRLTGMDVIHSFWVPSLAGKQDLIPGRTNELTIRAERAGIYRGQCAEFCGVQHAHMALLVIAQDQADFDRWQREQGAPAAARAEDDEQSRGQDIFTARQCAACHTIRGTSATGTTGPDLTHIGSRQFIGAGLLPTTRGSLAAWTADPQTLKPGNNMPLVPLAPDELRAVSAYLAGLR